jgi:type I restriction enzyme M protein
VVLANPPYSIKQWNREGWTTDPWGRNFLGTPPQQRADYAFFQHILKSMDAKTGRCAILFPHGVLFRKEEAALRRKLVGLDVVDCVLGLGANLFSNSAMEACVVFCCAKKPPTKRGKVLLIDAVNEVARERAMSSLRPEHQERILTAYHAYADDEGFAKIATLENIAAFDFSLSIPLYVKRKPAAIEAQGAHGSRPSLREDWGEWEASSQDFWSQMDSAVELLDGLVGENVEAVDG